MMKRAYDNSRVAKKVIPAKSIPFSSYVEDPEDTTLYGAVFPTGGWLRDLSISVEKQEGLVRLAYEVERVRSKSFETKYIHSKAGANNLGSIELSKGDRVKVFYESIEGGEIKGVWISYTLEQ